MKLLSFILGTLLAFSIQAKEKVLVVGAGIIGSSISYHLAKDSADVTLIDMAGPASHASKGTFAWLNASWAKQPQSYHSLNQQSVKYWHQISSELSIPVKWGGSLEWFGSAQRQQKLALQITEQAEWGEAASMLTPKQSVELEPKVNFFNASAVAYSANDGAVDPVLATKQFIHAAQQLGAKTMFPCTLEDIRNPNTAMTSCGDIQFDKIILAVGANSTLIKKVAKVDVPQRTTPGIIVVTKPFKTLVNRMIVAPGVHIHQRLDGRIVLGEQGGAPKTKAHKQRLAGRPNKYPSKELALQHANRIIAVAVQYLPEIKGVEVEDVSIGWRPLPIDGHPVLGFSEQVENVYIATMHSGVTLAPIVGKLVAKEVISNKPELQLQAYRPNREFTNIKRY